MIFGGLNPLTLIDYPGKTSAMVYTIGCNFRCGYCHNPELVDETVEDTYSEEYVLSFLEKRVGLLDAVTITGGEPTMHEETLLSFMQKVKDLGFLVKLDSNGTNPNFLRKAIDRQIVDYIAMDIKAPLAKYYVTAGRPVDTDAIRQSVALLKEDRVDYEFRTTVIKILTSPEDIEAIAKEIEGAKIYNLQKFVPTKTLNPQFLRKTTYTDEEFLEFQKTCARYVTFCGIR
ncbi:anaerobic ribonucleoside-triphosphate reductase activating protein [Candidatus Kaiserbacteria bacterium RIFCSPHIGHO2_02_FULL_49_34]|uniref:Anaerobic ribonucleoside-triphosphate reductase activating protein n=1 Tax=Candidatus Kaiserbacteria bacterium RIFCSPHIGHO2_02_FULL_49_34 TaxID=1798491 RepID=A0A1F6DKM1_9BACT|nr:MAG: anaerobic ribonucleoside-triphosphate reductase activating protein [Candidatus Kaiserbacteria bacterium RIFCSPHIGHO2_02_FULL_49_34]